MEKKLRAHVIIQGRVQGVFFRVNTARTADRLGVSGWVRNLADGTVEAVVEGEKTVVRDMVQWCNRGDPPAMVTGVELAWHPYTGEYDGFDIRY